MTTEEEAEDQKRIEVWHLSAIVAGYNELVKVVDTIAQKVYCRLIRDQFQDELIAAGGAKITQAETQQPVLVITASGPWIRFYERDIEQMRAAVAKWDADKAKAE